MKGNGNMKTRKEMERELSKWAIAKRMYKTDDRERGVCLCSGKADGVEFCLDIRIVEGVRGGAIPSGEFVYNGRLSAHVPKAAAEREWCRCERQYEEDDTSFCLANVLTDLYGDNTPSECLRLAIEKAERIARAVCGNGGGRRKGYTIWDFLKDLREVLDGGDFDAIWKRNAPF